MDGQLQSLGNHNKIYQDQQSIPFTVYTHSLLFIVLIAETDKKEKKEFDSRTFFFLA